MEKLKNILIPKKIKFEKVRFGRNGDGGYIFAKPEPTGQSIFGFGVANDISCEIALNSYFGGKVELFESEETSVSLPQDFILHKKFVNGSDMADILKSDENIIIKMDIEGFEIEVLLGARDILKRDRPIILSEALTDLDLSEQSIILIGEKYNSPIKIGDTRGDDRNYLWIPKEKILMYVKTICEIKTSRILNYWRRYV